MAASQQRARRGDCEPDERSSRSSLDDKKRSMPPWALAAMCFALVLAPEPALAQNVSDRVVTYLFSPFLALFIVILPLKVLMMTEAMGAKLRYSFLPITLAMAVSLYLMITMTAVGIVFRPEKALTQLGATAGVFFLMSYVIDSIFLLVIASRVGVERIAYASALANGVIFVGLAGFTLTLYTVSRETFDFILFFGSMVLAAIYGLSLPLLPSG